MYNTAADQLQLHHGKLNWLDNPVELQGFDRVWYILRELKLTPRVTPTCSRWDDSDLTPISQVL